jgi:ATP-dependent Zn protease
VRTLLVNAEQAAEALLRDHRAPLDRLVEALLEQETLEQDALRELLGETPSDARQAPESGVLH